jgi:hypothetical protein
MTSPPVKCGARNNRGEPCRFPPVPGAAVCRFHGGNAPQVRAKAASRVASAQIEAGLLRLGVPLVGADPAGQLLEQLAEAAGNVAFLRSILQKQQEQSDSPERPLLLNQGWGTDIAPLVRLYGEWCDRVARLAKLALDAGVAERTVLLLERQADLLADLVERVLADPESGLDDAARMRVRGVWVKQLRLAG